MSSYTKGDSRKQGDVYVERHKSGRQSARDAWHQGRSQMFARDMSVDPGRTGLRTPLIVPNYPGTRSPGELDKDTLASPLSGQSMIWGLPLHLGAVVTVAPGLDAHLLRTSGPPEIPTVKEDQYTESSTHAAKATTHTPRQVFESGNSFYEVVWTKSRSSAASSEGSDVKRCDSDGSGSSSEKSEVRLGYAFARPEKNIHLKRVNTLLHRWLRRQGTRSAETASESSQTIALYGYTPKDLQFFGELEPPTRPFTTAGLTPADSINSLEEFEPADSDQGAISPSATTSKGLQSSKVTKPNFLFPLTSRPRPTRASSAPVTTEQQSARPSLFQDIDEPSQADAESHVIGVSFGLIRSSEQLSKARLRHEVSKVVIHRDSVQLARRRIRTKASCNQINDGLSNAAVARRPQPHCRQRSSSVEERIDQVEWTSREVAELQ